VKTTSPIWSGYTAGRLGAIVRRRSLRHMPSDYVRRMEFGTIIIVVSVVAVLVAAASYWGSGRMYRSIGASDLVMEREAGTSAAAPDSAEAREEIRQMLEAKSARRQARGEEPLDVDAELQALTQPAGGDPGLREEVRQLVVARNERRLRQGKEPLDVEAEVERQLRALGG
jgi:hypothetical protein